MSIPRELLKIGLLGFVFTGCGFGESGPTRIPITGEISLDGVPIKRGVISLETTKGDLSVLSASIADGRYVLDGKNGPPAGTYKVSIWSDELKPTGRKFPDPDNPRKLVAETRNAVPTRYNLDSRIAIEVKPETSNTFDFKLTTKTASTASTSGLTASVGIR